MRHHNGARANQQRHPRTLAIQLGPEKEITTTRDWQDANQDPKNTPTQHEGKLLPSSNHLEG